MFLMGNLCSYQFAVLWGSLPDLFCVIRLPWLLGVRVDAITILCFQTAFFTVILCMLRVGKGRSRRNQQIWPIILSLSDCRAKYEKWNSEFWLWTVIKFIWSFLKTVMISSVNWRQEETWELLNFNTQKILTTLPFIYISRIWLLFTFLFLRPWMKLLLPVTWNSELHKTIRLSPSEVKVAQLCPTLCDPMDIEFCKPKY